MPGASILAGASMGGFGAYRLAARFPDRFASVRSFAGSGLGRPLENLRHVPIRGLHGDLDHSVPICLGRSTVHAINTFGGRAIFDEFPGVPHRIPTESRKPAAEWAFAQILPQNVAAVRYTATDELARGAYWVRVEEWGSRGMPASIDARVEGGGSTLHVELENVQAASIDLKSAPIDPNKPLQIVVGENPAQTVDAPLPPSLWISRDGEISANAPPKPPRRLHFPGGSFALYHGEPLLIVPGTQGTAETTRRLAEIAKLASRSADGKWPPAGEDEQPTVFQMTTGRLRIRADDDVTDADLQANNLVLLGDATQNSVVRKIAKKLPVAIRDGRIRTHDGFAWDYAGRALGLLHFNPLAERRLIYWVAAADLDFYRPGTIAPLTTMMDYQGSIEAPADFIITDTAQRQLIAARRFDSRWNWEPGYGESPILERQIAAAGPNATKIADAVRRHLQADFGATTGRDWYSFTFETAPGVTRLMDVAAMYYGERAGTMELTGREIFEAEAAFRQREKNPGQSSSEWFAMSQFVPKPAKAAIEPERTYRIAFPEWAAFTFGRYSGVSTDSVKLTGVYLRDIIEESFDPRGE